MVRKIKMTAKSVTLILRPSEKLKKPRLTSAVEKPTFKALKKKFFTGPLGKRPARRYDSAEPSIPPIIIPVITFDNLLLAILPPCLRNRQRPWFTVSISYRSSMGNGNETRYVKH